jgi:hypothetical protein
MKGKFCSASGPVSACATVLVAAFVLALNFGPAAACETCGCGKSDHKETHAAGHTAIDVPAHKDVSGLFPNLEGWTPDPEPAVYDSETLYEYINGAADLYINYDFQELAALYYERGEDQGIVVDIYRHSTPRNAFGIYSQERPKQGDFIDIGTQGYHDTGILNFVLGDYYVKLSGYSLGEQDESLLKSIAADVADRIGGKPGFPPVVDAFPDKGKVPDSEVFVAINFMGHGFLHSAYVTDYAAGETVLKLFIMEAENEAGAQAIVDGYLALAKKKGEEISSDGGRHRFMDPYQKSKGAVNLMKKGNYVWGLISDDTALCDFYIDEMGKGLESAGLLPSGVK